MLVANPAASQFTGGDHRSIVGLLSRHHMVEAVWPNSAGDARIIAADAVTAGFDGVVAMGGDGIVHQVAQALVDTDVFMAVIPAGTTNVFARQLGLPSRPLRAARALAGQPPVISHPVVTVEGVRADGTGAVHHAVFALGAGMDADVVVAAESEPYRKYRFGAMHYARTTLGMLWRDIRKRPPTITVTSGPRSLRVMAVMAQFHPAFTYFGRRPVRFLPEVPDPMTLLLLERLPFRRLPPLAARLAAGRRLDAVRGVEAWRQVETFSLQAAPPARMELDGEVIGEVASATVTHRPDSLWVVVPPRPPQVSPPAGDRAPPEPG